MLLKEVRIKITTTQRASVITQGSRGATEVSNFENRDGKYEYSEKIIVPEDAIVTVEDVE